MTLHVFLTPSKINPIFSEFKDSWRDPVYWPIEICSKLGMREEPEGVQNRLLFRHEVLGSEGVAWSDVFCRGIWLKG